MNPIAVYRCPCDLTRLRILKLLLEGPLCVCHLAAVLDLTQPKVSRHHKALKDAGAVETERCYNWTICRVVGPLLMFTLAAIFLHNYPEYMVGLISRPTRILRPPP